MNVEDVLVLVVAVKERRNKVRAITPDPSVAMMG